MAPMTSEQIAAFLQRTRQAILLTSETDGRATGVPVWFDWDRQTVRMFSARNAPKVTRIENDPRISVLVTNDIDEPPTWVSFEGRAVIDTDVDARALAIDVLAPRYWDLDVPEYRETVDQWAAAPAAAFVIIRLNPERIRSSI